MHFARIGGDQIAGVGIHLSPAAGRALCPGCEHSHSIGGMPMLAVMTAALNESTEDALPGSRDDLRKMRGRGITLHRPSFEWRPAARPDAYSDPRCGRCRSAPRSLCTPG